MRRNGRTPEDVRDTRYIQSIARRLIIEAVNEQRDLDYLPALTGRHINTAVCVARRKQLVTPDLLEQAGFNGV